jgi:hypothetical protein
MMQRVKRDQGEERGLNNLNKLVEWLKWYRACLASVEPRVQTPVWLKAVII